MAMKAKTLVTTAVTGKAWAAALLSLPLLLAGPARADLLLGNMDADDDVESPLALRIGGPAGPDGLRGVYRAAFTTPDAHSIFENVKLRLTNSAPDGNPFVSLWEVDPEATPAVQLLVRLEEDRPLEEGHATYTFTASEAVTLKPNTRYHLVVSHENANNFGWVFSEPWTDPAGSADFLGIQSYNSNTNLWGDFIPPRPKFEINVAFDDDGDGVPNDIDFCPDSILTDTVIIDGEDTGIDNPVLEDGCTIADLVHQLAEDANHGEFVSGVANLAKTLVADGTISARERSVLIRAAAQSGIGRE